MRKSRKFISMPIISIEEGQQIGSVRSLVIDPVKMEIAALIIEQRGWFKDQKVIPYHKVHSVGGDAITIEKNTNAEKQTNLPSIVKLIKDKYEIIGDKVVAEGGIVLGYVDEYYVDLPTGKITTLEISGRFLDSILQGKASLDIKYIKTIGKEVLIAIDGAENYLQKLEGGLKESVKNITSTTSNLWELTVKKTKALTHSINNTLEKKKNSAQLEDTPAPNDLLDNQDPSQEANDDLTIKEINNETISKQDTVEINDEEKTPLGNKELLELDDTNNEELEKKEENT